MPKAKRAKKADTSDSDSGPDDVSFVNFSDFPGNITSNSRGARHVLQLPLLRKRRPKTREMAKKTAGSWEKTVTLN